MNARDFQARLVRRAKRSGATILPEVSRSLWIYFDLLIRWNRKINLTALDEFAPDEAIDRLLLEPVIAAKHLPSSQAAVLDVGSGGGSPAIPLKLSAPGASMTMVESKVRKCAFLREVIRELGLKEARVENVRVEELLARPELHEALDVVTIRAVRVESRLLMALQAFLLPGGQIFLFRTARSAEPDIPLAVRPLAWHATYPLVESLDTRLVVLQKRRVGAGGG